MFRELKMYERYGAAPGKWIPPMPEHWQVIPGSGVLKQVALKNKGLVESTVLSLSYGRIIVKPPEKLHGLVPESFETYQVLESGDIVIRPTDLQNDKTSLRVGLVRDRGIITSAYIGLRASGLDSKFAFIYLAALDHMKIFYGMGSGLRQNLDFRDFKRLPIPVPPAYEQAAIVKYLGHAHARIDRAIAAKRKLIALLEEQKQAIIHQAVTRGLDPSVPLKDSGIARIGMIPAHWEVLPLKRLARFKSGAGFPIAAQGRTGLELPFAKVSDMNRPGNEEWMATADSWISRGDAKELGAYIFPVGTVVFPKVGGALLTNKRRRLRVPACIDNNVMGAVFGRIVADDFGYLTLSLVDMGLHVNPGPVPAIGESAVGRIVVTVPPRREQSEIVDYTVKATRSLTGVVRRVMREIELLREFRTRLTSDVVTGQVDVREIAATLPERTDDVLASAADKFSDDDELIEPELEFVGADE